MTRTTTPLHWLPGILLVISGLLANAATGQTGTPGPERREWEAPSQEAMYRVKIRPEADAIPVGDMHRWTIEIKNAEGEPVYPAQVSIGGGMQGHGHGLPTQPQVVAYGGDGVYLVDGVRFNMEGEWRLSFVIASDYGRDRVDFDINVEF